MEKIITTVSIDKPNLNELSHFGIPGMKWGKRMARGHAGPSRMLTKSRQLDANKRDLKTLDNGGHLSKGFTKKRQEKFDARDRRAIGKSNDRLNRPKLTPEQTHARTKKILMVAGAVTVTAALAYGGYKMHNARVDRIVSESLRKEIKTIHVSGAAFQNSPLGKQYIKNASPNMARQSTKDLAKEMKSFASSQAALRDQLRNLNR